MEKIYYLIESTPELDDNRINIDISSSDVYTKILGKDIINCVMYLRSIKDALNLNNRYNDAMIINNLEIYIKDILNDINAVTKTWEYHNKLFEKRRTEYDHNNIISNMTESFIEFFDLPITKKMISLFVHFVTSSDTMDKQSYLERCIINVVMPVPYNDMCSSFNLFSIVSQNIAIEIYNYIGKIVESMSSLISLQFGVIDYMIEYIMMIENQEKMNINMLQFIKTTIYSFKIENKIDHRFILICICEPSMVKNYIALYDSLKISVSNMPTIMANSVSFLSPELLSYLNAS